MLAAIVPNSAKPFNFHKEFQMTEEMVSYLIIPLLDMHLNGYFAVLFFILYTSPPTGP